MDEEHVESLRREIGEKMARDGEPLHESASDSLKEGYRRASMGFGSNVMPRKFNRVTEPPAPWVCVCGHENPGNFRRMVGKREVCWQCGIEKELAERAGL